VLLGCGIVASHTVQYDDKETHYILAEMCLHRLLKISMLDNEHLVISEVKYQRLLSYFPSTMSLFFSRLPPA